MMLKMLKLVPRKGNMNKKTWDVQTLIEREGQTKQIWDPNKKENKNKKQIWGLF